MTDSASPFGDISIETFLREYWQKKPLLIRNAFPNFEQPIEADELAGLACEEEVESRLVTQSPDGKQWAIEHGPFSEDRFGELPESHWTLLVQAVDHWVPHASELVEQFRFLPNWRYDDLMVTFATQGGGVGPHFDNYDVFLVQGQGQRRWEVGGYFDHSSPRRPDTPVMIIPDWHPEETWVLEAGDMLYIPPQVGHNGVSETDDCMTFSVGFRAPSHEEIMRAYTDHLGTELHPEIRYNDNGIALQPNPGQISADAIAQVKDVFMRHLNDEQALTKWFGSYVTEPKYPEQDNSAEEALDKGTLAEFLTAQDILLRRNEGSRFAFYDLPDGKIVLFVDGETYTLAEAQALAKAMCQHPDIVISQGEWTDEALTLICDLFNKGALYSAEEG